VGDYIRDDEMWTYGNCEEKRTCMQDFGGGNLKVKNPMQDVGVIGRIILKLI
jgi:hypothetical protein